MKLAGIIAEYDPFHNGHAWQLAQARARGAERVAVAMSCGLTQRGALPLLPEAVRVRAALTCGADFVFALPAPCAGAGAEAFARAGVRLLSAAGCDALVFGAETPDAALLMQAARVLLCADYRAALKAQLADGARNFAAARQAAVEALCPGTPLAALLDTPGAGDSSSGGDSPSGAAGPTGKDSSASSGGTTTPTETAPSGTTGTDGSASGVSSTAAGTVPTGGNDLAADGKKVFYPPAGASFAPLTLSMKAAKPLAAGTVTSRFGYRENPTGKGLSFHQALDVGADTGSAIAAMYFGVVEETGENGSYGKYIKIYIFNR